MVINSSYQPRRIFSSSLREDVDLEIIHRSCGIGVIGSPHLDVRLRIHKHALK